MEIDPDSKISPTTIPARIPETEKPSGMTFEAMLDGVMDASKKADPQAHDTTPTATQAGMGLKGCEPVGGYPVIAQAERLLDMLGEYQRQLADPAVTLRQMSPLIRQLEICRQGLVPAIDLLADEDELKNILNEIIITSSVEIVRFNRGDYVNPWS